MRRLVGYGRLEGIRAVEALARLYTASRLFVNFFRGKDKQAGFGGARSCLSVARGGAGGASLPSTGCQVCGRLR